MSQALQGHRPRSIVTKYIEKDNPYKSLYGSTWKEKILKRVTMKRFISINDLVHQI